MQPSPSILRLTARVVAAYLEANASAQDAIPGLIRQVHGTFKSLASSMEAAAADPAPQLTSAQIRASITDDWLTSFENGRRYKTLRRHLQQLGLSPADYRAKWGLPEDYPMTAANCSAQRSALARRIGLGSTVGRHVAPAPRPSSAELP